MRRQLSAVSGLTALLVVVVVALASGFSSMPANGIRVQLQRRALHSSEHIRQHLECLRQSIYYSESEPESQEALESSSSASSGNVSQPEASKQSALLDTASGGAAAYDCSLSVGLQRMAFTPFVGRIQLGQPPQEFEMLLDTGSHALWVGHEQCQINDRLLSSSNGGSRGHRNLYVPERSQTYRTYRNDSSHMEIKYGNGVVYKGDYACDVMQLEDRAGRGAMVVEEMCFATVRQIDTPESMSHEPQFDGIIGLSWPLSAEDVPTLMDTLIEQKLISEPVFTVYLTQPSFKPFTDHLPPKIDGELTFGKVDHTRHTGEIVWAPLVKATWTVRLERVSVIDGMDREIAAVCVDGCDAVVDTGTHFVVAKKEHVDLLNDKLGFMRLPYNPEWTYSPDCLSRSRQKNLRLVFQIAGRRIVLNADAYGSTYGVSHADKLCLSMMKDLSFGIGPDMDYWLLGSPFIEQFYTIFDYGQRRIGFALKADSPITVA